MSWLLHLWGLIVGFFRSLFKGKQKTYRTVRVEELPDVLAPDTVYIAGEDNFAWYAAFLCPCGCRETVFANLLTDSKPYWRLTTHSDETLSLYPSIWRTTGCKSHFYLRHGIIQWCTSSISY